MQFDVLDDQILREVKYTVKEENFWRPGGDPNFSHATFWMASPTTKNDVLISLKEKTECHPIPLKKNKVKSHIPMPVGSSQKA